MKAKGEDSLASEYFDELLETDLYKYIKESIPDILTAVEAINIKDEWDELKDVDAFGTWNSELAEKCYMQIIGLKDEFVGVLSEYLNKTELGAYGELMYDIAKLNVKSRRRVADGIKVECGIDVGRVELIDEMCLEFLKTSIEAFQNISHRFLEILENALPNSIKYCRNNILCKYEIKQDASCIDAAEAISTCLDKVRSGDMCSISESIGRVNNIESKEIGTGTIIYTDDMPEQLKGRVILTAAHMIPDSSLNVEKITSDEELTLYVCKLNQDMTFLTDTSDEAQTLRHDIPYMDSQKINEKSSVIGIEKAYLYSSNGGECYIVVSDSNSSSEFLVADITVAILKEPLLHSNYENRIYVEQIENPDINSSFIVGYGRPAEFCIVNGAYMELKHKLGWGEKKIVKLCAWETVSKYGWMKFVAPLDIGPSDSGSLIFQQSEDGKCKPIGILPGNVIMRECLFGKECIDFINHAIKHAASE